MSNKCMILIFIILVLLYLLFSREKFSLLGEDGKGIYKPINASLYTDVLKCPFGFNYNTVTGECDYDASIPRMPPIIQPNKSMWSL